MYMYHSFLIHSSANGRLGCFHVLAIVNGAAIIIGIHVSQFWFPRCICPAVRLLCRMAVLFPVFKGISTLFFIVSLLVWSPTNSVKGSFFSTPSPAFIVCRLFDSSHSDWREMVPHCGFDLDFSDNEWCWAFFHVFLSHLYVFFGEMSVYFFDPFLDWVVYFSGIELHELLVYFWD